ncbi:MAG TPA: DinB family protein [Bacteroidota bacterium]|jgi:uncharacterized damage-inducible protein DinB
MTEKEIFVNAWKREFATTLKILKQLPADKADFKPDAEKTKSAKDLATMFIGELGIADGVVNGKVIFGGGMPKFSSYPELLNTFEKTFNSVIPKIEAMSESDWNSKIAAPVGPKQMGEVRRADMFWLMLNDSIHHRGQFSIYLRMVGAKVPSIYGPSGDEPWT